MSKTLSPQLKLVEADLNDTAEKLCLRSLNTKLDDEDIKTPTVTWNWGWSLDVGYKSDSIGSRYTIGANDSYIGSSSRTVNHVQKLVTLYENYENHYFVKKLGDKLPSSELDNFNMGSISLGSSGINYISSDACDSCDGGAPLSVLAVMEMAKQIVGAVMVQGQLTSGFLKHGKQGGT